MTHVAVSSPTIRTVRQHELGDLPWLAKEAHDGVESFLGPVDEDHCREVWEELYRAKRGLAIGYYDYEELKGAVGCIRYQDMFSGEPWLMVAFLYVPPRYRGRGVGLLRAVEKLARHWESKAIVIGRKTIGSLQSEGYEKLLKLFQYEPFEVLSLKRLVRKD